MLDRVFPFILINLVVELLFLFLAPFNHKAFIADNLSFQLFDIHIRVNNPVLYKPFTIIIAPVQVYGPYKCLKDISVYIFAKMRFWDSALHKLQ